MNQKNEIVLGIDGSNIRHGGGITHLSQLLQHAHPQESGIIKVVVWSNEKTSKQLPNKSWLKKKTSKILEGNIFQRIYWQAIMLTKELKKEKCNILFVPGGSFLTRFRPIFSMHQNLLPFEFKEIARYGVSLLTIKWIVLRLTQSISFKKSNGIIFLSRYSKEVLESVLNKKLKGEIIPHGVEQRFFSKPRKQISISEYSFDNPFKLIYVSSVDFYKHQWNVVEAVSELRNIGYPLRLDLYGHVNKRAMRKLERALNKYDKDRIYINIHKEVPFTEMEKIYQMADISIFASSCETFGQIIIESMASGLPICCSNMSSMPEILKDGAVYFNPLDINEITEALRQLIESKEMRSSISRKSYNYAKEFNWEYTSKKSFDFFRNILKEE